MSKVTDIWTLNLKSICTYGLKLNLFSFVKFFSYAFLLNKALFEYFFNQAQKKARKIERNTHERVKSMRIYSTYFLILLH